MPLTLNDRIDSLQMLDHTSAAYPQSRGYITGHLYPVIPLSDYEKCAEEILNRRKFTIFTRVVTAYPAPNGYYFTNLGKLFVTVLLNLIHNPYIQRRMPNMHLHPQVDKLAQIMTQRNLALCPLLNMEQFQYYAEELIADLKVQCKTRAFTQALENWNNRYTRRNTAYDNNMEFVLNTAPMFEVHSLLVSRKRPNGRDIEFGDYGFNDIDIAELLEQNARPIIQDVWRQRYISAKMPQSGVITIASKREADIFGTESLRLFFKKDYSDWLPFEETAFYNAIAPHLKEDSVDSVSLGDLPTINAAILPLQHGQEFNFYDANQKGIGKRLDTLKAHILGTEYWVRYGDVRPSFKVERGSTEYNR